MKSQTSNIALGKPSDKGDKILERRYILASRLSDILIKGGRLLDIGCGNGAQTAFFIDDFSYTVGVDVQHTPMAESEVKADWVAAAAENLPFPNNTFDAVITFEVLEHVVDPVQMVKELYRVLKPGGQVVLSVPNKWWIFETHGAYLPLLPWNRVPFFSWLPESLHDRWAKSRIYTRKKLDWTLREGGFNRFSIQFLTAPMDRARPRWLQRLLQRSIFYSLVTKIPFMAVNLAAIITK